MSVKNLVYLAYTNFVRPILPTLRRVEYHGVAIARTEKLFDSRVRTLRRRAENIPDYEEKLVLSLSKHVQQNDRVTVIGGGEGVTAVLAAKLVAPRGKVICYEGSKECVRQIEECVIINGVKDIVMVRHSVVGPAVGVYHEREHGVAHPPKDLEECDVLEMDCEGSELAILEEMKIRPRVIVVETHGSNGASTAKVREALLGLGYGVTDMGIAEPRLRRECEKHDIRVLVGVTLRGSAGG